MLLLVRNLTLSPVGQNSKISKTFNNSRFMFVCGIDLPWGKMKRSFDCKKGRSSQPIISSWPEQHEIN